MKSQFSCLLAFAILVTPVVQGQTEDHGQESRCGWRLHSLASFLEFYRNERGRYPEKLEQVKGPLPTLHCAGGEEAFRYEVDAQGQRYTMLCVSNRHRYPSYPRYSNRKGLEWK